jgi:hypothetical protein
MGASSDLVGRPLRGPDGPATPATANLAPPAAATQPKSAAAHARFPPCAAPAALADRPLPPHLWRQLQEELP